MIVRGRLINKERPTLIIRKSDKLKKGFYGIKFVDNDNQGPLRSCLQNFNNDFYCFTFVHKVTGAFRLKYQHDYLVSIEKEK